VHLRSLNVDPGLVDWDAWRREDGRWTLTATYSADVRDGQAAFTFDAPGNYVSADDEDARWLVGDGANAEAAQRLPALRAGPQKTWQPYAGAGWPPYLPKSCPSATDALDLVADDRRDVDQTEVDEPELEAPDSLGAEAPVEAYLDDPDPLTRTSELDRVEDDEEVARRRADEPPGEPAGRPAKRKGRASVPSWDEIMFGGGKHD